MEKNNLRIIIIDLVLNTTNIIEKNNISKEEVTAFWKEYVTSEIRGASGSKIGYESAGCPNYHYNTGVILGTNKFVSFVSWETESETDINVQSETLIPEETSMTVAKENIEWLTTKFDDGFKGDKSRSFHEKCNICGQQLGAHSSLNRFCPKN